MPGLRPESANGLLDPLTRREREILVYLADGLSNQEIAARLHLALRTVKWYNTQLYSKLGVRNRREAVEQTAERGLLATSPMDAFTPAKHNLPPQATRFVGRQRELAEISALLADPDVRLLTVLAPGGMGKTRLVLEAARAQIGSFADGIYFVPLAPLSSAANLITTIAESIGFSFYGENTLTQQVIDFLRDRSLLLVLDNFEHLLDGAPLVAEMTRSAPGLRVLTTSREQLNLRGETIYALRGLDFPAEATSERARDYDAVKLFVLAAQRVRPGFALQAGELTYLARICRLTAGMPLAIELAAGWVDILSLEHIGDEIQAGIDILHADLRDLPERHRSVRATFERTWSRLSEHEQATFARLSVFRGGFSLSAAQAIAGAGARHLRGLAQKALIQSEGDERFGIHELLRQFGADKLAATGELPIIQSKHADFFADFMQERRNVIFGSRQYEALDQIGADFENVRTAWYVLVERQAFDQLPNFLDGLQFFLDLRGRSQEGVELFETTVNSVQLLPPSDTTELALARLLTRLAWFYNGFGLSEKGKVTAEAAINLLDRYDSPKDRLVAYQCRALIYMLREESETAHRNAEVACTLARQLGDRYWEAHSLLLLSHASKWLDNNRDAILLPIRQARAIYESLGNPWGMLLSYTMEAEYALEIEDYEQAKQWSAQCQGLAKAVENRVFIGNSTAFLGIAAFWQGNYAQAWDWLRQALQTYWDAGHAHYASGPLLVIAQILLYENKAELASEILALTERYQGYGGYGASYVIGKDWIEKLHADLEATLGVKRFAAAWARGRQSEFRTLVAELLSQERVDRL